jgi:adenylate cyclase
MPPSVPSAGRLQLRAQRSTETGQSVSRDFAIPLNQPVRLGREPRMREGQPDYNPDFGSDLVVPGDQHISNFHATLTWDGQRLQVQRRPAARNPVFLLDRVDPDRAEPRDDFSVTYYDRFRIGNTIFSLFPDTNPIERTCTGDELRAMAFIDPAPRIEALAALPDMIRLAPDEEQLIEVLLKVAMQGVPRADVAALVQLDAGGTVGVRAARGRYGPVPEFVPSRRLVLQSLQGYENVSYIWPGADALPSAAGDTPTIAAGTDWAICIRLFGPRDEGLYLAGRAGRERRPGSGSILSPQQLSGDMKFTKLAGDVYSGLRDLFALRQREAFLAQLLSPPVRRALAGQRLEDVTAPREVPVTVLFCDLRGSVQTIEKAASDLLGTWGMISEALDVMTEAIVEQDGVIGDFQGDAAMGFWGWPIPQDDQVERAARAALLIRKKFVAFSRRKNHPLTDFVCGIGLASGPAVAGKLGTADQAKIGVFGPVVNRAARLEAATKKLRVPILVDTAICERLAGPAAPNWCRVRRLARVLPQGLPAPILIGELLPPELEPGPNLSEVNRRLYEAALDRFLDGDWGGFLKMIAKFPPDGPAAFVTRYVEETRTPDGRAPEGWNGGIPVAK